MRTISRAKLTGNITIKENFMFFRKKNIKNYQQDEIVYKYKAVYKSMRTGNVKEFLQTDNNPGFPYFMEDQEMFYLSHIEPNEEGENENRFTTM